MQEKRVFLVFFVWAPSVEMSLMVNREPPVSSFTAGGCRRQPFPWRPRRERECFGAKIWCWGSEQGGVCLGGMINESTPCCHLYFGIQSKAQFSVKYYIGLSRRQSLMLMYEWTESVPSCYRTEGGNHSPERPLNKRAHNHRGGPAAGTGGCAPV